MTNRDFTLAHGALARPTPSDPTPGTILHENRHEVGSEPICPWCGVGGLDGSSFVIISDTDFVIRGDFCSTRCAEKWLDMEIGKTKYEQMGE